MIILQFLIEYDNLLKELEILEIKYPQYISDESPTQRLGHSLKRFKTIKHRIPMQSLANAMNLRTEIFDIQVRKNLIQLKRLNMLGS